MMKILKGAAILCRVRGTWFLCFSCDLIIALTDRRKKLERGRLRLSVWPNTACFSKCHWVILFSVNDHFHLKLIL